MTSKNPANPQLLPLHSFKKIMLIGCPGSGKTTLARQLHDALNIPLHHLDKIMWQSGWQKKSPSWTLRYHKKLCLTPSWIIDGNHIPTLAERCQQADLIIFFITPRWRCMIRIFNRWLLFRKQQRTDLARGCFDELNHNYLDYAWHFHKRYQPILKLCVEQSSAHIMELRSAHALTTMMNALQLM